nr:hypothetical protein [Spirochaetia bacterium]
MKKTLLIFLALALVGTFAFAEAVVGGEAAISGSVSLTAGYDLDNEGMGFVNDSDIQIVLPILAGDAGASGDDGVYGEIKIENINWQWDLDNGALYDTDNDASDFDGLDADISATVYFNSLYVGLGAQDFWINNVDVSDDYTVDAYADAPGDGFTLGFMNDMFDVALSVSSIGDYRTDAQDGTGAIVYGETGEDDVGFDNYYAGDDDPDSGYVANVDNNFAFGVKATINAAEGITIPVSFTYYDLAELMAFGMAPSVVMGDLTLDIPVD